MLRGTASGEEAGPSSQTNTKATTNLQEDPALTHTCTTINNSQPRNFDWLISENEAHDSSRSQNGSSMLRFSRNDKDCLVSFGHRNTRTHYAFIGKSDAERYNSLLDVWNKRPHPTNDWFYTELFDDQGKHVDSAYNMSPIEAAVFVDLLDIIIHTKPVTLPDGSGRLVPFNPDVETERPESHIRDDIPGDMPASDTPTEGCDQIMEM